MTLRLTAKRGALRCLAAPLFVSLLSMVWISACEDTYDAVSFKATHNSYSGGSRDSIPTQLDLGVRFVEMDIHLDDFPTFGYRVGHDAPGDGVSHGNGNPLTDSLADWLRTVANWSDANPNHAPITLLLDFKDSLLDAHSFQQGNHAALNQLLMDSFPGKLFRAEDLTGTWPLVEDMRGRLLAVMSGDEDARLEYLRDRGSDPAVDMNQDGSVVEMHDSGSGDLWYWTGRYEENGVIRWKRHGRTGTGRHAAVAVNSEGWLVSAFGMSEGEEASCFYRVGRLLQGPEIQWITPRGIPLPGSGDCDLPTLRFVPPDGNIIREIHQGGVNGESWVMDGILSTDTGEVLWTDPEPSPETPPYDKAAVSLTDGRSVTVFTGTDGPFRNDTLLYATRATTDPRRIRYEQVAFSEHQLGGHPAFALDGVPFYATNADNAFGRLWASLMKLTGGVVRLWGFNDASYQTEPPVNFPATDVPFQSWYEEYSKEIGTVQ